MHKNAAKCNKTQSKWCINKHGASKIIDTFETYQEGLHAASSSMVCRLWHSLYGIKLASHAWFERFSSVVTAAGFSPNARS
jgi:hypothetical protein